MEDWTSFKWRTPEGALAPGQILLVQNGWQALIAFEAGPERVRQVPIEAGSVIVTYHDGDHDSSASRRTATAEERDLRIIYDDMVEYLRDAAIAPPPPTVQWVLDLPSGHTEESFWDALNSAAGPALDNLSSTSGPASHSQTRLLELRAAVKAALAELYQ